MVSEPATSLPARAPSGGYTTREVADTLGLAQQQIRRYGRRLSIAAERGGRGEYRFSFQDLVLLRTAKSLLDADVAPRRALAALAKLCDSAERPLSAMRVSADGDSVVVREDDALWNAETGQGHLSFAADRFGQVRALPPSSAGGSGAGATVPLAGRMHEAKAGDGGQSASAVAEELDSDDCTTGAWIWRSRIHARRQPPISAPSP